MINPLNELSAVYMQNIAEESPEQQSQKITQIVKAIRYRARKEGVELSKAYNDYIGSVQATATERQTVKEKLGLTGGAAHKEEVEYVGEEEKWIQKAIKKPGALKKQLGVPEDEEIPAGELKAAAKKGGKLGQRARLAVTLKGLNKEEIEIEESGVGYEAGKPAEKLGAVSGIPKSEQEAARERIKAKMAAKKAAKKVVESSYDPMDDDEFDHDEAEENRGVSGKNNPKGGKVLGKKKKVVTKEQFYNWREEFIFEVEEPETDTEEKKHIKDKKVNNKVIINPPMKEAIEELGGTLIEMSEVEEGIGMTMANAMGNPPVLSKRMKIKQSLIKREIDKNTEKNKMKKYSGKAASEEQTEEVDQKQMQQIQRRQIQLDRKKLQLKQQAARQGQETASDTTITSEGIEQVDEVINMKKADMGDVVKDFYKSDAPQFKGKSKEKRRQMAIAAKLEAERGPQKEEVNPAIEDKFKKAKTPFMMSKFRKEHPGSRQPKKTPGAKPTEGELNQQRIRKANERIRKHGLTSKEKGETKARAKYDSARD